MAGNGNFTGNSTLNEIVPEYLPSQQSNVDILLWGFICAGATLFGLALATCKYFRDQYDKPESKKKRKDKSEVDRRDKEERAVLSVKKDPIPVDQFLNRLKQKKTDKHLNIEVRAIVRNQDEYPCSVAMELENVLKNVNQDVVTFDHSRVMLEDHPPGENNYINASYIDGYSEDKEYIATQGPRQKNIASFWHMVWEEEVHCIVMATGLFENASQQCDKYWGDVFSMQKYVCHGKIHIWLESTIEMAQLTIRNFRIQRDGENKERMIRHYEMVGFNDEATDAGFLLDCVRRVNTFMLDSSGPILVHCRCGGGKTAVFIALDYCLKQIEKERCVDVYNTVLHLRKFRKNMVRTLYQYRLIYESIAMHIQCGTTVVPSAQLSVVYERLSVRDPKSRMQGFEKQYLTLKNIVPKLSIGECAGGHRSENRTKSRDIMLVPPERARPYLLTSESSDNGTDFINAVFTDGYYQENNYLVTQWPLHNTVNDIWRLLYDYKITCLVVLNEPKFSRSYPCFWPSDLEKDHKYGPIGVRYLGCQKFPNIVIRAFAVRKLSNDIYDEALKQLEFLNITSMTDVMNEYTVVKVFHLTCWPAKDKTPTSTKSLVYLMGCVEEWQQKTNPLNPICIMSKDGVSRCGAYCAASICCDQLKAEGEVDVFNAVRIIKKNRPELVPNVSEYMFIYTFVVMVIELMQEDRPKIIITGPTTKSGQKNRGYLDISQFNGNMVDTGELSSAISKISPMNMQMRINNAPDGSGLAARGQIICQNPPVSSLQIPSSDDASMSSCESFTEQPPNKLKRSPKLGSRGGSVYNRETNAEETNNNRIPNGRRPAYTGLQLDNAQYHPRVSNSLPSRQKKTSYPEEHNDDCAYSNRQDLSTEAVRPKPTLHRQDATDIVEMKNMDKKNRNKYYSREISL